MPKNIHNVLDHAASSSLWWGCVDFIGTPCESTVTITDLLMNQSIGYAAN